MKILIVGGTGVLSSAVVKEAIKQGIEVTVINRGLHRELSEGVILIKSDKDDFNNIISHIKDKQFDAIIDFLCFTDVETAKSFNFYKNFTKQYFFISSCAVYDTRKKGIKNEDSAKVLPIWKYSIDKWASEKSLVKLAIDAKINYTIIRPCITYDDTRIPYGITPHYGYHWTLVERIKHDKPIIRWNEGENRSSMMRVEDFAVGVVGLVGNKKAMNQVFNICGDEAPTFNEVLAVLEKWIGKKVITFDVTSEFYADEVPSKKGEILGGRALDAVCCNEKIKDAVPAFRQNISLEQGVKMTLQAYNDKNYQRGIEWAFDAECDRVIRDWCNQKGIDFSQYNVGFIDYLGNASNDDKKEYKLEFNKDKTYSKIYRLLNKVIRKIRRLI